MMDRDEAAAFSDRIAATAIVNQAGFRCMAHNLPLTGDNITRMIGDFFDPNDPRFANLIRHILYTIEEIAQPQSSITRDPIN